MEFHLHRHPSERLNELVFCAVFSKCHWLLLYLKEVTRVYHSLYWNEPVSFASNDPSVQESFSILAVIKWGSHAGKVQLQVFGVGSQRTVDPPWSADSPGVLLKGSVLPWHHMSVQDLLHCATKTPANRSVPTALQAGCCPPPPPLPTQCWGAWKFQLDRREIFSSELKGLKILSCQREKKGRRVVGYGKGGTVWNLRWQDLCGVSLLGTNKPQDDLIFKTCWTCWQEQSLGSSLQRVCLLLLTAFQLPSDSVCFLGICFLVQCSSSPDCSPAEVELLWAKVQQGCRHPTSPALLPGG